MQELGLLEAKGSVVSQAENRNRFLNYISGSSEHPGESDFAETFSSSPGALYSVHDKIKS